MAKPYVLFCGDKEKCRNIMKSCSASVRTVFITKANADKLLAAPTRHPFLICMIFPGRIHADDELFIKIYRYSSASRCPIHIIGSRRNLQTVSRYVPVTLIQRSDSRLMLQSIRELAEHISSDPNAELAAMKSRFRTVSVISANPYTSALCENKLSASDVKPRIIFSSPRCTDKEFGYLNSEKLSGIITDAPLNGNSLALSVKVSSEQMPVALLDRKENYGRKVKVIHLDSKSGSHCITQIIDDYNRKRAKLLFIRSNKKKST